MLQEVTIYVMDALAVNIFSVEIVFLLVFVCVFAVFLQFQLNLKWFYIKKTFNLHIFICIVLSLIVFCLRVFYFFLLNPHI